MYQNHPSSFEQARNMILAVGDVTDFDASHHLLVGVKQVLASRFREETSVEQEGPFDVRYATDRINGVIAGGSGRPGLQAIRGKAARSGACPEFLEAIDLVLAEARAAFDVALNRPRPGAEPERPTVPLPDWAKVPLGDPDLALDRPDLSDI